MHWAQCQLSVVTKMMRNIVVPLKKRLITKIAIHGILRMKVALIYV